jgi:hypothetical protein
MLITNLMIEFLVQREGQDEMLSLSAFKKEFGFNDVEALTVYDAWQRQDFSGHRTIYVE